LKHRAEVMLVEGSRRAAEMVNPKVLNIFMLGALSMLTPFSPDKWEKVIAQRLSPKVINVNIAAFKQGRHDMLEVFATMPDEGGDDDGCGCH
jgi:Pyruvate/2-oxoacid:ferredoxin oxidoreductase gamma subunit